MLSHISVIFFALTCCSRRIHLFSLLHLKLLTEQNYEASCKFMHFNLQLRCNLAPQFSVVVTDNSGDEIIIEPVLNSVLVKKSALH